MTRSIKQRSRVAGRASDRRRDRAQVRQAHAQPPPALNKSRTGTEPGHGGEGLSKGYGGGSGDGVTSPAGPEDGPSSR